MCRISIEAIAIRKEFTSGAIVTTVLNGLTLAVAASELTLISGPSGCGKSTLLAILSGLLRPDRGQVHSLGVALTSLGADELDRFRLRHTGFVFQAFHLFPALTALEQVMLPLKYLGIKGPVARLRAARALEEVGLDSRATLRPHHLSGGEQQRVAIARALAKEPLLLFTDEPTSALDAVNGQIIIDILHRIARRHGATVVCVSHDPRLVAHADRVLAMEDGRISEVGTHRDTRGLFDRHAPVPA